MTITLVEKLETVCVGLIVGSEEIFRLLVNGIWGGGVLDIFTEEFPPLMNLFEVTLVETIETSCVWFIIDSEEKLWLLVEGKKVD